MNINTDLAYYHICRNLKRPQIYLGVGTVSFIIFVGVSASEIFASSVQFYYTKVKSVICELLHSSANKGQAAVTCKRSLDLHVIDTVSLSCLTWLAHMFSKLSITSRDLAVLEISSSQSLFHVSKFPKHSRPATFLIAHLHLLSIVLPMFIFNLFFLDYRMKCDNVSLYSSLSGRYHMRISQ